MEERIINSFFILYILKVLSHLLSFNSCNQPWLVWLSGLSTGLRTKGSPVQFLVRAHAWVVVPAASGGDVREATTH